MHTIPGCWMAEVNLGKVPARIGAEPRRPSFHYENGVRLKPEAKAYYDLGDPLMDSGRYREAEARSCEALRLNPHAPEAHINLFLFPVNTGRLSEGAAEDKEALRLRPSSGRGPQQFWECPAGATADGRRKKGV